MFFDWVLLDLELPFVEPDLDLLIFFWNVFDHSVDFLTDHLVRNHFSLLFGRSGGTRITFPYFFGRGCSYCITFPYFFGEGAAMAAGSLGEKF
eukprot:UN32827